MVNTNQSWGQKLMGSIKGILIGLLLFIASFIVIYVNEGSVDVSRIAATAIEIDAQKANTQDDGKLVTTIGNLVTTETLGDTYLQPGNYIVLSRNVEMYAWEEEADHDEDTGTTYTYNQIWTSSPEDSADFAEERDHENPKMPIESTVLKVAAARIGNYDIDVSSVQMPLLKDITIRPENAIPGGRELEEDEEYYEEFADIPATIEQGKYLFKGFGNFDTPEIGDIRINYSAFDSGKEVTIFGKLNGNKISPYIGEKDSRLYRIFEGTADESIVQMRNEYRTTKWIFRGLGFILMWIGLSLILGPISATLDFIPVIGSLSRSVIGLVTFIASLIMTTIVIWLSMLLHNIWAIIVVIALALGIGYWYINSQAGKPKTSGPDSPPA
jgi:hypothetical protein